MSGNSPTNTGIFDTWSVVHFMVGFLFLVAYLKVASCPSAILLCILTHQIWEIFEQSQVAKSMWNNHSVKSFFDLFSVLKLDYGTYDGDSATNTAADTLWFTLGCSVGVFFKC